MENEGLEEAKKTPAYHDEPLLGNWQNHRSIRLNSKWRVIYHIIEEGRKSEGEKFKIEIVEVVEVTDHDYSKKKK